MAKLKPKEKAFYGHFSAAAHAVAAAASEVKLAIGTASASPQRAKHAERLTEYRDVASSEYRAVLLALRASFVTPFERTEIQDLSHSLDDACQALEGAGALINLLDPASLPSELADIARILEKTTAATEETIGKLKKLKGLKHHHEDISGRVAEAQFHHRLLLVRLTSGEIEPLDAIELTAISEQIMKAVSAVMLIADVLETVLITEG